MHLADINAPARGAYLELSELIALRFPAKQLKLTRREGEPYRIIVRLVPVP